MGATTVLFDEQGGAIKTIAVEGKLTSISNFAFVALKRADTLKTEAPLASSKKASIKEEDNSFSIKANNVNGLEKLK